MLGKEVVRSLLDDWRAASISPQLQSTLEFIEKLTLAPDSITPDDAEAMRRHGVSDAAITDAIYVCFLFNVIDRLADTLGFALPTEESHDRAASILLKRGYAMPAFLAR